MEERQINKHRFLNPIVIIPITVIILGMIIYSFIMSNYQFSVGNDNNNYTSAMVSSEISISLNNIGVPHIVANNEKDMIFGMGFIHARDRLWQMELNRRLGKGQLSELLGKDYVLIDKFMRSVDLPTIAQSVYDSLSDNEKHILNAYTDGVNEFLRTNKKQLPFEFGAFDLQPKAWKATDCIIIQRLFALRQSTAFWFEPLLASIAERLDKNKATDLLPNYLESMPYQFEKNQNITYEKYLPAIDGDSTDTLSADSSISYNDYLNISEKVKNALCINPSIEGCNLWVSKKNLEDSTSGVILANDLHSALTLPTPWYLMHYTCPGINVCGVSMPGLPFAITGRNDYISWGMTSMHADDCDFCIVEVDSTGQSYKNVLDSLVNIKLVLDTINIAENKPHIYFMKNIENSNVMAGVIFDRFAINEISKNTRIFNKYAFICKWTGQRASHEIEALYKLSKAENMTDFTKATSYWATPGVVFGYGDVFGNFGLQAAAKLPYRSYIGSASFPIALPAWKDSIAGSWRVDYRIFNDTNMFVVSANNKLVKSDSMYISNYWANWSRASRISDLLMSSDTYDVSDAKIMQSDIYSVYAKKMLAICIPVWEKNQHLLKPLQQDALQSLKNWDGIFSVVSPEASIFMGFMDRLLYNVFADELGQSIYRQYIEYPDMAYSKIYDMLIHEQTSPWFDNITTKDEQENAYYIIFASFIEGVNILAKNFQSTEIFDWRYEHIHNVQPKSYFADNSLLSDIYKYEKLPVGGSQMTITNSVNYSTNSYGATMRFITDMEKPSINYIMPGGQSGDPVSINFTNQISFWKNAAYYKVPLNKTANSAYKSKITIKPK